MSDEPGPGSEQVIVPQVPPEPGPDAVPTPTTPTDQGPATPPVDPPVVEPPAPTNPDGRLPATGGSAWSPLPFTVAILLAGFVILTIARTKRRATG